MKTPIVLSLVVLILANVALAADPAPQVGESTLSVLDKIAHFVRGQDNKAVSETRRSIPEQPDPYNCDPYVDLALKDLPKGAVFDLGVPYDTPRLQANHSYGEQRTDEFWGCKLESDKSRAEFGIAAPLRLVSSGEPKNDLREADRKGQGYFATVTVPVAPNEAGVKSIKCWTNRQVPQLSTVMAAMGRACIRNTGIDTNGKAVGLDPRSSPEAIGRIEMPPQRVERVEDPKAPSPSDSAGQSKAGVVQ